MKILIVDDSIQALCMLREQLRYDHEVIEASSGSEGHAVFGKNPDIDVLIVDYNMPDMNGLEMLEKAKVLPHYKNAFVIIMTTETSKKLMDRAKELGARLWMLKPPDRDSLLFVMNEVKALKSKSA